MEITKTNTNDHAVVMNLTLPAVSSYYGFLPITIKAIK